MKSVPVEKEAKMKFAAFCPKKDCNGDCNYSGGHSLVVEVAQRIVDLTGYGQALHVNDILPDLKELVSQTIQAAISAREKEISDEVIGAVARGWTHEVNAKKIMDSDLALAIEKEIYLVIHPIDHQ